MRALFPLRMALVAGALATLAGGSLSASPIQGAAPEDPAVASQDDDGWVPLTPMEQELATRYGDHFVGIAGEELLTLEDLKAFQRGQTFEDPASTLPADITPMELGQARLFAAATQRATEELKIQGGKTQGYDPELVQRALEGSFQAQIDGRGGPVPFADWIQGLGFDANSFREFLRNRLFAQLWTDAVTGRSAGPTGRVYVDSYVRPAEMYRRYQTLLASPSALGAEEIGRLPARVTLRRLVISCQRSGGPERALELAEASREYLLNNTITFDEVVEEYAPEDLKGEASQLVFPAAQAAPALRQMHPEWPAAEFLAAAAPGDLSPVLPVSSGGPAEYMLLYRFEGRTEATEAVPFGGLELQRSLRDTLSEKAQTFRVDRGISELARTSRVAPNTLRMRLIRGPAGR